MLAHANARQAGYGEHWILNFIKLSCSEARQSGTSSRALSRSSTLVALKALMMWESA